LTNCHGFCSVYHFGTQDIYNVMVMDLLGPSLEDLFNKCSRRFTLKTVLQIADQLLERVDTLHSRHLIHRDIKPANFVIGVGDQGANVYCVDFGLSKRYRHPKNLQHIPHRDGRSLTGTPRYASINNHLGIEQSRRDDLESIGYVLIYFLKGTLPWQGLKAKNAQKKYRMILEKKQQVSIAQLCQGCPSQFAEFLAYTRSLKFDAKPDIPYLRKLFRDMYHTQGCASMGKLWDWDNLDNEYSDTSGTAAPPALGSNPPRPSTAAAVASNPTGVEDAMVMGDDYDQGASGAQRPSTAGVTRQSGSGAAAGQTGNWNSYNQGQGQGQSSGTQQRPHTAGAGRVAGQSSYPNQQVQVDPRTAGGQEGDEGEDGPHVVAGARAMMRYRRTRAATGEGQAPAPQQAQGAQGPGAQVGKAGWTGGEQYAATGQQQQRSMYQNPGKGSSSQQQLQQQQLLQQQQMSQSRAKTSGNSTGQRISSGQQQGQQQNGGTTGWMSSNGGAAGASDSRPKSAGMMGGGMVSGQRQGTSQQQAQAQAQGQQSSLTYGSLRSRFLSGGADGKQGSGQQQQQTAVNAQTGKSSSASKLFSISR
jgi:hypothetical protein